MYRVLGTCNALSTQCKVFGWQTLCQFLLRLAIFNMTLNLLCSMGSSICRVSGSMLQTALLNSAFLLFWAITRYTKRPTGTQQHYEQVHATLEAFLVSLLQLNLAGLAHEWYRPVNHSSLLWIGSKWRWSRPACHLLLVLGRACRVPMSLQHTAVYRHLISAPVTMLSPS